VREQGLCALISLAAMDFISMEAETVVKTLRLLGGGRYKLLAKLPKNLELPVRNFEVWVEIL